MDLTNYLKAIAAAKSPSEAAALQALVAAMLKPESLALSIRDRKEIADGQE